MAIIDDSFKRPGAVPFSWEIRPGVPKTRLHQPDNLHKPTKLSSLRLKPLPQPLQPPPPILQPPSSSFIAKSRSGSPSAAVAAVPPPSFSRPLKLKPPSVSGFYSPGPRTPSFRSSPRACSERWQISRPNRVRPEYVAGPGCFPTPLFGLKKSRSGAQKKIVQRSEPDYGSDPETMSPWSISSRRSVSPFWDSPKSSSFSSHWLSPRFAGEAEWAGFGLF